FFHEEAVNLADFRRAFALWLDLLNRAAVYLAFRERHARRDRACDRAKLRQRLHGIPSYPGARRHVVEDESRLLLFLNPLPRRGNGSKVMRAGLHGYQEEIGRLHFIKGVDAVGRRVDENEVKAPL